MSSFERTDWPTDPHIFTMKPKIKFEFAHGLLVVITHNIQTQLAIGFD
jgi:hypothetical protein